MVKYRQAGGRGSRGWSRPRLLVGSLVGLLLALTVLLGAGPAGADLGRVDPTRTSVSPTAGVPSAVGPGRAGAVRPEVSDVAVPRDGAAPAAATATATATASLGWHSGLAKPVLVIGLVIVIASIVSILRDI
jgi:hypothetical protein